MCVYVCVCVGYGESSSLRTLEREQATMVFVPYYTGLITVGLDQKPQKLAHMEEQLLAHLREVEPDFFSPQPRTFAVPSSPPSP